jgi:hypothetical protein
MHESPGPAAQIGPEFTGCCKRFDPAPYQDKQFQWHDELFVKEHVKTLMHIPLGMGKHVLHANKLIDAASAWPDVPLMLTEETSAWGVELYVRVAKPVPGAEMVSLSGSFLTKVFEGPFKDEPKWIASMREYVAQQGKTIDKLYFAYTTCPACAKAYGVNYVVAFARVA